MLCKNLLNKGSFGLPHVVVLEGLGGSGLVDLLSALAAVESQISLHHLGVPLVNGESVSDASVSVDVENLHGSTSSGEELS
jgi:hypothetical protein